MTESRREIVVEGKDCERASCANAVNTERGHSG